MKKILVSILGIVTFSCGYESVNRWPTLEPGTYEGIFYRSSPGGNYDTAGVSLTFTATEFTGESDIAKYPAICHGTYAPGVAGVKFTNACIWTAEFDWSYILEGEFQATTQGDSLVLTRTIGDIVDTYKLKFAGQQ